MKKRSKAEKRRRRRKTIKTMGVIGREVGGTLFEAGPAIAKSIMSENPAPLIKYAMSGKGRKRISKYGKMIGTAIKKGRRNRQKRRKLKSTKTRARKIAKNIK